MASIDPPDDPAVSKSEIFREQALQAWRGQEAETRLLLDLSPRWLRWALVGIFLLAGVGMFLAATTAIPNRATSTASPRLSSGGDSVLIEAVFSLQGDTRVRPGHTMSFRPPGAGAKSIDLVILSVLSDPGSRQGRSLAASPGPAPRILVRGAIPLSRIPMDMRSITGPGSSGTVQILIGQESLLHLLRPRAPGGMKA